MRPGGQVVARGSGAAPPAVVRIPRRRGFAPLSGTISAAPERPRARDERESAFQGRLRLSTTARFGERVLLVRFRFCSCRRAPAGCRRAAGVRAWVLRNAPPPHYTRIDP